ncbi:MAG: alpha/beta fold hydrolase, partial [Dehalococcoidia bacterium]
SLDGVSVRYLTAGSVGPSVILIHGLGNSLAAWQRNITPLSQSFRVYALDLPGHGLSTGPGGRYDLSFIARFMGQFLDHLKLTSVNLIGSSMGGLVAMKTALELPERVYSLVLVGSAGLGREMAYFLRLLTLPGVGEVLSRPSWRKTRWGLKNILYDHSFITDALVDELHRYRTIPGVNRTMLKILRYGANFLGQKDKVIMLDRLESLKKPTLVVWGAQDSILPASHSYAAHRRIQGSRLHVFQQCGHWPQMEKSGPFNELVTGFLKDVS